MSEIEGIDVQVSLPFLRRLKDLVKRYRQIQNRDRRPSDLEYDILKIINSLLLPSALKLVASLTTLVKIYSLTTYQVEYIHYLVALPCNSLLESI